MHGPLLGVDEVYQGIKYSTGWHTGIVDLSPYYSILESNLSETISTASEASSADVFIFYMAGLPCSSTS